MTYDPWQQALNNAGGLEGIHIRCAKGSWSYDDEEIRTGNDGASIVIVMETAVHGSVRWEDRMIVERRIERYADTPPSDEPLDAAWSPYTAVQCIGNDTDHIGRLMTFTSSSWGGRRAFSALLGPYLRKGRREFPICTLGTRPKKNDPNGNIDPLFTIVGWVPRSDFADMLPPSTSPPLLLDAAKPALEPPKAPSEPTPSKAKPKARGGKVIDDEIPF
jgi:hypothetical protein